MREFKFRCFDKMEGYMLSWQDLLDGGDLEEMMKLGHEEDENYSRLMQYTGLKDEGGIEIYEGDIIYFTYFGLFDTDEQHNGIVKYDDERAEYMLEVIGSKQEERFSLGWIHYQDDEIEIIGNIHENPELPETK